MTFCLAPNCLSLTWPRYFLPMIITTFLEYIWCVVPSSKMSMLSRCVFDGVSGQTVSVIFFMTLTLTFCSTDFLYSSCCLVKLIKKRNILLFSLIIRSPNECIFNKQLHTTQTDHRFMKKRIQNQDRFTRNDSGYQVTKSESSKLSTEEKRALGIIALATGSPVRYRSPKNSNPFMQQPNFY